jgi:hypothetical protein
VSCISAHNFPEHFLGAHLLGLWRWWVITSLVTMVHAPNHWEEIPPRANGQLDPVGGFIPQASRGEGLGCTTEPSEAQESTWEQCSSDWWEPRFKFRPAWGGRRGGDQLIITTFWGEAMTLSLRRGAEILCFTEEYKTPPRVTGVWAFPRK